MKVVVLLSTYNGCDYLKNQLDSLIRQKNVDLTLVIRDDGSDCDTIKILEEYRQLIPSYFLLKEENIGAEASFNSLCTYALENTIADYYAFCDQDDVWEDCKLSEAIQSLQHYNSNTPNLYFSNLLKVDDKLNSIGYLYGPDEVKIDKKYALMQIFTYGCTCVFNRKALEIYCSVKNTAYHDNWLFAVCAFLGNTYYDKNSHILYRQHQNNLSMHKGSGFCYFFKRFFKLIGNSGVHTFETIAKQLLQLGMVSDKDDLKSIYRVANYRNNLADRLYLFFGKEYLTGNFVKDLSLKYRIISGKL